LPTVNLAVAKKMLASLANQDLASVKNWQHFSRLFKFPRFEHIFYQQWNVLHEGFRFKDVTNLTGYAKWGSYLEDPLPNARIGEMQPLWVSSHALVLVEDGFIPALSREAPPLLIFHADQEGSQFYNLTEKNIWKNLLLELLALQGRTDYTASSFTAL